MSEHHGEVEVDDWHDGVNLLDEATVPAPPSGLRPILFVPSRRAADPALKAVIAKLAADLEALEARLSLRQRKRRAADHASFRLAIEALACNALVVSLYGSEQLMAVPRSHAAMWSSEGAREPVYGQHFLDALALFAHPDVGFMEDVARGYRYAGSAGQLSTVRVLPRFRDAFGEDLYDWKSLHRDDASQEVLALRDVKEKTHGPKSERERARGKPKDLPFLETDQTNALRDEVRRINDWLATAPLIVADGDSGPLRDHYDQPVDPTNRRLRRIFSNADWRQGGRLFGGFWQNMRRKDRSNHLLIATDTFPLGEPIITVDYGQLFARLAYHEANAAFPEGDLYDVFGCGFPRNEEGRRLRDGIKRVMNALLFGRGDLKRWPRDTLQLFPEGTKLADVRGAIYAKHPALRPLFGSGVGYSLMFTESEILIAVLQDLQQQGVYALPIHDAVLVAQSNKEAAVTAMTAGIRRTMGLDLGVTMQAFEPVDF